jgi:hypothetical protein
MRTTGARARLALCFAADYVARGWRIFPMRHDKRPLTAHGSLDATLDAVQIEKWWQGWPDALIAIATGKPSRVVALDVDIRPGVHGPDALEALDVAFHPATPTAHTPSGGYHIFFAWPGHYVKTIAGKLGRGLDIRGDGGSIILPPGPGRFWDPHLAYDGVPLAEMPSWMKLAEPAQPPSEHRPPPRGSDYTRYGEVAINRIVAAILNAPLGQQEITINSKIYSIGQLVAGGEIGADFAMQTLVWLSTAILSLDAHRPWRPANLLKKMQLALADGMQHPRTRPDGR